MSRANIHKRSVMSPSIIPAHTLSGMYKHQVGASLIVSLMLLVVLTLLGLSSMQSTIMQERMSNNVRDKSVAFQATESAVRTAEAWVRNQDPNRLNSQTCAGSPCNIVDLNNYANMTGQSFAWWQTNGNVFSGMPSGVLAANPHFIVELHSIQQDSQISGTTYEAPPARTLLRLTATGVGNTSAAEAMIETLYARID